MVSDSQSSLRALKERSDKGRNELVDRVEEGLVRLRAERKAVVMTWAPSHCG